MTKKVIHVGVGLFGARWCTMWLQPSGTDWTVFAFLTSPRGLALEVARDEGTVRALLGALTELALTPVNQLVVPPSLDADYSVTQTKYDALTDGLLIVRYMFNLVNNPLAAGALGPTAGRTRLRNGY